MVPWVVSILLSVGSPVLLGEGHFHVLPPTCRCWLDFDASASLPCSLHQDLMSLGAGSRAIRNDTQMNTWEQKFTPSEPTPDRYGVRIYPSPFYGRRGVTSYRLAQGTYIPMAQPSTRVSDPCWGAQGWLLFVDGSVDSVVLAAI